MNQAVIAAEVATWERCIAKLEPTLPADPAAGIFGPGSAMWRVARESVLPIHGIRAVLLQIAHPVVAQAGVNNSNFKEAFLARTERTFTSVYAMMFADRQRAIEVAQHIHLVHTRVAGRVAASTSPRLAGRDYRANEPELLFWVLATMIESAFGAFDKLLKPMDPELKQAFYEDMCRLGMLLAIPRDQMPPDVRGFQEWFDRMVRDQLEIGPVGKDLVGWLFAEGWKALGPIDEAWTWGILEPEIRDAFGLPDGRRWKLGHYAIREQLRFLMRTSPRAVRYVPPFHTANYRMAQASGARPGKTARAVQRLDQGGWLPGVFSSAPA